MKKEYLLIDDISDFTFIISELDKTLEYQINSNIYKISLNNKDMQKYCDKILNPYFEQFELIEL